MIWFRVCVCYVSLAVVSSERTSNQLGRFGKNRDLEFKDAALITVDYSFFLTNG